MKHKLKALTTALAVAGALSAISLPAQAYVYAEAGVHISGLSIGIGTITPTGGFTPATATINSYTFTAQDSNSAWNLVNSCTLTEGTTSHGTTQPLMVPLDSASGIAGKGIPTGMAPKLASNLVTGREGPRIFMPLRSSTVLTGLSAV